MCAFQPQTRLWLCFGNSASDSMRGTSCLWFQTKAAPELWMVVSSGWGFLGKRRGCWHRLSGAEGSPHRVPVGAPAGKVRKEKKIKDWAGCSALAVTPILLSLLTNRLYWSKTGNTRDKWQNTTQSSKQQSYHSDTNPISHKATRDPNVFDP